jgi:hypothetical protein
VDAEELIRLWSDRRREILKTLPPDLLVEYRRLGVLIRGMRAQQYADARKSLQSNAQEEQEAYRLTRQDSMRLRISLDDHREALIAFLAVHGPSARGEIVRRTKIPSGSLSILLQDQRFEQVKHGLWRLRKRK